MDLIASQATSALESYSLKQQQQLLAGHFYDHMTAGDSFEEVNEYCKSFFAEVIVGCAICP